MTSITSTAQLLRLFCINVIHEHP